MSEPKLTIAPETTPAPKGLPCVQLPCPCCNEGIANVSVYLWTLDQPSEPNFCCNECNTEFSLDDVRTFIKRWGTFLRWLEQIPDVSAE